MTPERWQQVDRTLQSALERSPAERAAYLAELCAGDEALRAEVESLLAFHEKAGDFIEEPPNKEAAEVVSAASLPQQQI
jgi:eukaryotic-like serine/threonine-protein kinase